jgi:hypothetical protein
MRRGRLKWFGASRKYLIIVSHPVHPVSHALQERVDIVIFGCVQAGCGPDYSTLKKALHYEKITMAFHARAVPDVSHPLQLYQKDRKTMSKSYKFAINYPYYT